MIYNNIAVELLTKHRGRLEKELVEATQDKEEFLTSLIKVETKIRNTKAEIDQCIDEINRVNLTYTIGNAVGTTGFITSANPTTYFHTGNSCPKQ